MKLDHFQLFSNIATGASLKQTEYFVLNGLLCDLQPKTALEFGPGNSTIALAKHANHVESYEFDEEWLEKYRTLFVDLKLDNVHVRKFENTYPLTIKPMFDKYDVIFVDSPYGNWVCPGFEGKARFNAVQFATNYSDYVILHDTKREGERCTFSYFEDIGWHVLYFETELGLGLLYRS